MVEVRVFTLPGCAHCLRALQVVKRVAAEIPDVRVEEVDITQHPEMVRQHRLLTSPSLLINGRREFIGLPVEGELRKRLKSSAWEER